MTSVTTGQLQAQVSAIRKRVKNGSQVFAMRMTEDWTGPDRLQIDGTEHLIMPCISDLQAREALLLAEQENKPIVLLCSVSAERLGDDVVSRFAKQRVFVPQIRDVLAELFSARIVDPRVLTTKPLCDALLDRVPVTGYPPVSGGALDLQYAWTAIIEQIVGERMESPSLNQILEWSLSPAKMKALAGMNGPLKEAFVDWFSRTRGEAVRFAMAAVDAGLGGDLIPIGMALGLVFSPEISQEPESHAARARLEKYFGGREIDPESARVWCRAAEGAALPLPDQARSQVLRNILTRLDYFLAELKLQKFAHLSSYSPLGLSGRFDGLGRKLQKTLKAKNQGDLGEVQTCFEFIQKHVLAPEESDRIGRAEMAIRLVRWLSAPSVPDQAASLPDLARFYHLDGGFLDWARNRLRETDVSSPLQTSYQQILGQVDAGLVGLEKQFSEKLAEWTRNADESTRLICIEDVLAKVVIPASKEQPVLLLVLDGMSVAVYRQLISDIERQNWIEIAKEQQGIPAPVLATLPSITQISRRALFLGKLDAGISGNEQSAFANNDYLFKASDSQMRPRLFLKGDLQEEGGSGLSEEVKTAIAEKKCRVVGLVVNAVDDHLDSGDQVVFTWGLDRIKPLREILKLAAESGRIVVMTSDHGHVLDFGTRQLPAESGEAGDRYRYGSSAVKDGEMIFEGTRVKNATGRDHITLACDANVRYGAKKRGYHGGANPQEMVIPMAVLATSSALLPSDWTESPPYEPTWWRGLMAAEAPSDRAGKVVPPAAKPAEANTGLDLFEHVARAKASEGTTWIEVLLSSDTYQQQAKLAVRGGPSVEIMTAFLQALEKRGGSIMKSPLAQALGVPMFRVDGLVQNISRILNIDGYEVLAFDRSSDTITINVNLLKTQFEIG